MTLRVGLVLDSLTQPAWIARVIETIRAESFADVTAVILHRVRRESGGGRVQKLYERIDSLCFRSDRDALAPRDLRPLIAGCPLLDSFDKSLDEHAFDVLLAFESAPPQHLLALPRHGVWTCHFDGWPSFLAQEPTTTCVIEAHHACQSTVVASTRAGTDPISLHRGMSRLAWKAEKLLTRQLAVLNRDGVAAPGRDVVTPAAPARRVPALEVLGSVGAATRRFLVQKFRDYFVREQWFIAFRFATDDVSNDDLRGFHHIVPPRDRLWADPFVVADGPRAFIFIEELVYAEERGVIAVIEVRPDGSWSSPRRVLERPYHLSYPCVFRWNGEWYMVPETLDSGTIELYRSVDFPWRWDLVDILFRATKAVDTTIFEAGGRWWMYTTTAADGKTFDELSIYYADSPRGPWITHRQNPVLSDIVGGRCAGRPFLRGGRLLRAAQNNARRYGHAVQLREIETLTPDRWNEIVLAMILPDWTSGLAGTHTYNADGAVTVIDGMRYRWGR